MSNDTRSTRQERQNEEAATVIFQKGKERVHMYFLGFLLSQGDVAEWLWRQFQVNLIHVLTGG